VKLSDRYDGSEIPFEGERMLIWRSLPTGARVLQAHLKLKPAQSPAGGMFEEVISFPNGQGSWGASKTTGTDFVEVDFHKRRTLARVMGTGVAGANLQVDIGGGVYVEINSKGAIRAPGDGLFTVPSDGKLPGLLVTKFKLTGSSPNVAQVIIRSVPTNVSVRLGNLAPFWTHLGELTSEDISPDFAAVLRAFLIEAKVENGFYQIPLSVHSDTIARLVVELEVEYLVEASLMPAGLDEVQLPYDFGSLPKAQENVLQLAVPQNMRVAPNGVTAQVRGAFEDSRIVYGPTGEVTPVGTAEISPAISQAQMILLPETLKARAFDFCMTVAQSANLQLDLREDLDGKPGNVSLLPGPVKFELSAPTGTAQDHKTPGELRWANVVLPAEFQFQKDRRYWLVLQSLEGQANWNVGVTAAEGVGMQHTRDGGSSWRSTVVAGISEPLAALFRLRHRPDRFQVPIELQVGTGEQAVRVKLDRFQPLGRVDFALDFDEVAQAFNQYLATASPISCPETEHIANGDFEQWLRIGDQLMPPTTIDLSAPPATVAVAPDGSWAYAASMMSSRLSNQGPEGLLQIIDVACDKTIKEMDLNSLSPTALAIRPDGTRAYVAGSQQLQVIDTSTHQALGVPLNLQAEIKALALSPDGGQLYVACTPVATTAAVCRVRAIDTAKLEQAIRGQMILDEAIIATYTFGVGQEPTALIAAPDGSALYVVIIDHNSNDQQGGVCLLDAATLQPSGDAIPVGKGPTGIALTMDGEVAVITNKVDNTVSVVDTVTRAVSSIHVGQAPIAVAISLEGTRAYVANGGDNTGGDNTLSVIDLPRRVVVETITVGTSPPTALALTPQGDRIYVARAETSSLTAIQVGMRLPVEWNLTSGWVTPFCLPDPFHLVAVLGQPQETVKRKVAAMPSALSQTVPVAESCPYEFSFYGIATDADALAEVLWIGKDCGLLRTDQVPIEVLERQRKAAPRLALTQVGTAVAERPLLRLHRVRLMAPAGAEQAEVRFHVPEGVAAVIDQVSLMATTEALANADLSLQQERGLAEWDLRAGMAAGVTTAAGKNGRQLRNASAETAEWVQAVPVKDSQPFELELCGRTFTRVMARDNPRLELRWFKSDRSAIGAPVVLEIPPFSFDSALARGVSPVGTSEAELHLVVPSGTTLEIRRISLRFSTTTPVPATFIVQAPGELTVSNWRVALERAEASTPLTLETGLCSPTPPGRQPGENPSDSCFCPCCETERILTDIAPTKTRAGRPAWVGRCTSCGAELVLVGRVREADVKSLHLIDSTQRR
jgi:YVTN family beta-propeller protein